MMALTKSERDIIIDNVGNNCTPKLFEKRLLKLYGTVKDGAEILDTPTRTVQRWIDETSKIPGVAWVALDLLERARK
jgi:hypothetical protein